MPFDWMQPTIPATVREQDPARRKASQTHDVRTRAALLQRLGKPASYALHRCIGNNRWSYELSGEPPLTDVEIKAIIADVYARRPSA